MENNGSCKNCRKNTLVPDDVTGNLVCTSCDVVQDFDNFQAHIGGVTGAAGTYVRVGTVGAGGTLNYKENKVFESQRLIMDITFKLGISGSKTNEIKVLAEKITEGEYGRGRWFTVFVGACAYVVMRKDGKMLPIVEVADVVDCDVYELGRMIGRVVGFVDLKLPEFDIVNCFERSIRSCPSFDRVSADTIGRMMQQGVFLVQCLIKWFITTGRRPIPVVAAVLVFVGELNEVPVNIDDVANELHVVVGTCKKRYKELLERLVEVARVLPWGKDVTVKNILRNAPFVIQYMEMKSNMICNGKRKSFEHVQSDIEGLLVDCLGKEIGYGICNTSSKDGNLDYFEVSHSSNLSQGSPDRFQISPECLSIIYSRFLDEVSFAKVSAERGMENRRKPQRSYDLQVCTDWWEGKSELSKKLVLMQIFDKDVGLDATPPSFVKGSLAKQRRQEKIINAKGRIHRIMNPYMSDSGNSKALCASEPEKTARKRKKIQMDIDWEDLIIETLLLHNVEDDEIVNGHYNVLLALHVFDNGIARLSSRNCNDDIM
ncbi:transcription factor IIIB 50 kDa subunit [Dorcoceras hygrometricum]|uniref:Transcription factor IIIB 50 kDa subunit n=1 Tax=Dorcoceras hygrometricum TaxID=472368 RepID=A0A2Z7AHA0_9LAMI|nr:transcription factor IIIB 50 kDa subunit [Dorcoceras hygrometricum]